VPGGVPFFTWVKELTDVKGSPSAAVTVEDEAKATDQQMFATGRTAMCLSWSNQASSLDATSGQNLEMLRVPSTTGKFTDTASRYKALLWSVSSRTKHPEAAAQVIDVLVNQPTAVTIIKTERGMPPHQVRSAACARSRTGAAGAPACEDPLDCVRRTVRRGSGRPARPAGRR